MVAASRLRTATVRAQESRGMWQPMVKLLGDAPAHDCIPYLSHKLDPALLFMHITFGSLSHLGLTAWGHHSQRQAVSLKFDTDVPKNVIVPVTSDRGLCGGINSGIAKCTLSTYNVLSVLGESENKTVSLAVIGEKGRTQMRKALGSSYEKIIVDTTKIPLTFNAVRAINTFGQIAVHDAVAYTTCYGLSKSRGLELQQTHSNDAFGRMSTPRFFSHRKTVYASVPHCVPRLFLQAGLIADSLLKTEFDAARIIYNKFKSAISFQPTVATVLSAEVYEKRCEATGCVDEYEMEGEDRSALLVDMAEFQLTAVSCSVYILATDLSDAGSEGIFSRRTNRTQEARVLYNGMLENSASELGSRMSAMDSSTKNANEMLSKLTLTYNRSRQAAITTELIEIISGAAALEG
eukprot:9128007-Pyramimonas_sp.AAC.1